MFGFERRSDINSKLAWFIGRSDLTLFITAINKGLKKKDLQDIRNILYDR